MNPMLDADCTLQSCQCAANIVSVVTRGTPHQTRTYLGQCCPNAAHVADQFGRTALHMAASCGKFEVVDWLLRERHASLTAKDLESGWTALHRSIFHGQVIVAVYLISNGASLEKHDNEDLTPLDLAMKDRPAYAEYSRHGPSQVYSWGSNANFTLGHGGGKSRSQPDVVDMFVRDGQSIKQVVMCKFHTVFLTHQGSVFTCGHGQGGRLGHGNEEVRFRPHPVTALAGRVCEFVAAARDHTIFVMKDGTVFSCGQNAHHQLGHSSLGVNALTPKLISSKQIRNKTILGVAAGRFHSALHTEDAVFTFGLNAGQLGHAKGEKYVVSPHHVTTLHRDKVKLTHLATSDAATVCATKAGDIYVLNEYQCRKVASKQLNLLKVVACGGTLDSDLGDGRLQKQGGSELTLLVLNQGGKVHSWRSSCRTLRRCVWTRKREVLMSDVALSRQGLLVCTEDGEAFSGRFLHRKPSSPASIAKDSSPCATPQSPTSPQSSGEAFSLKDWGDDNEATDRVSLNRLPVVHRATAVTCGPNGLNFAVLQADPKSSLTELPSVNPSLMVSHMTALLSEADATDSIHDVVLKVGPKSLAVHKYILAVRSDYFHRLFLQTPPSPAPTDNSASNFPPPDAAPEVHDVTEKTDYQTLMLLLQYVYTDTCDLFKPDYDVKSALNASRGASSELDFADDFGDLRISDENGRLSAYSVYKERREKTGGRDVGGKKTKKGGGGKRIEADAMVYVRKLIDVAKKFGVGSLVKRLDQVKYKDGRLMNFRPSIKRLQFDRRRLSQLCDVVLCSEDGTLFPCHKCVLVARLEYFQSMLGSGWIEASSSDPLKMPLPSPVLSTLLEFIYTDAAPAVSENTDIELLCSTLATADQLLIDRLKEMCEVALVDLISLRNVAELLQFACIYQANQLKASCNQYIGLNLACLLEARALEVLSNDALLGLTKAYKETIHSMPYRIITPYLEGPDISHIEEEPSGAISGLANVKGQEVAGSVPTGFDPGNFDHIVWRAKAKRKGGRRTSTGKRRSLPVSESGDNMAATGAPPDVTLGTVAVETDEAPETVAGVVKGGCESGPSMSAPPTSLSKPDAAGESESNEQEVEKDCGMGESAAMAVETPQGEWQRKDRLDSGDKRTTKDCLKTPDKNNSQENVTPKRWQSPRTPEKTGPDLRTIMMSEAPQPTTPRKSSQSSRMTTPMAKKSQKQRRRDQERAADSTLSLTPVSPVEPSVPSCPWGASTTTVKTNSLSFRDLQMEEQRLMGRNAVAVATSPPSESRCFDQSSSGVVFSSRRVSESDGHLPSEVTPSGTSPGEVPDNPWHHCASSPPVAQVSFSEIVKTEAERREKLAKTLKKPFSLIQIEEKALEELRTYYQVQEAADEFIIVERATTVVATPLWRRSKDTS